MVRPIAALVVVAATIHALPAEAVELGTPVVVTQGTNIIGIPQGDAPNYVAGNDDIDPSVIGNLVNTGGNAISVCIADVLAPQIEWFDMQFSDCTCPTNAPIAINVQDEDAEQVCDQIDDSDFDNGCSLRTPDPSCTNGGVGKEMDIAGPFSSGGFLCGCTMSTWSFTGNSVAAAPTYAEIANLSHEDADTVDYFKMFVGGSLIEEGPFSPTLMAASNGPQLASAISGLSGLIDATYLNGVLTITRTQTGPTPFSGLRLEQSLPAKKTVGTFQSISHGEAAAANKFVLDIDGNPVDQSGVDFDAAVDGLTLLDELDDIPGIDVFMSVADTTDHSGPIAIPDFSCPSTTDTVIANIGSNFTVTDVNLGINIDHFSRTDLEVYLQSPSGREVLVVDQIGGVISNFDVMLDDSSPNPLNDGNVDNTALPYYDRTAAPSNPLSAFNGEDAFGTWTLRMCDNVQLDDGVYNRSRLILNSPSNRVQVVASTAGAQIFSDLSLQATPPQVGNLNTFADTGDGTLDDLEAVNVPVRGFIVTFDSNVQDPAGNTADKDVTNPDNYLLVEYGANETLDTTSCDRAIEPDDVEVEIDSVSFDAPSKTATASIISAAQPLGPGNFALFVCGTTSIQDNLGQKLDGNGDGTAGDDFVVRFSVPDFDGDGNPDYNDPDDDNDGVNDIDDDFPFDPTETNDNDSDGVGDNADPDDDNDGVADGLDMNPTVADNFCVGENVYTFDELQVGGTLTCAATNSITVSPVSVGLLVEVLSTGNLHLIAPIITFENGFHVLTDAFNDGKLTVTSEHPCPGCDP